MSRKETARGAILARVETGAMTLRDAVPLLQVSYRQAKRLYARYRVAGTPGLVHGHVGRASNACRPVGERETVLALIRAHYSGSAAKGPGQRLGPTLVAEHLWQEHGLAVPRTTLRRWMRAAGLWSQVRTVRARHVRRVRKAHFGELVQFDGSFHDWYEGRGSYAGYRSCVMSLVDDATGTTLLRFGAEETIWSAVALLRAWIAQYGVPRALYTDKKNLYTRPPTLNERSRGEKAYTQFGRMCATLGIQIIEASTPQAKGRVERGHGTHQDRLVKKLRLAGISEDAAANAWVTATYLPQHNARFAIAAASPVDYHLPRDPTLRDGDVWCLETSRVVGNDFVVRYGNRALQLDRTARGRVPAKSRVLVQEAEDGRLQIVHVGRDGVRRRCAWTDAGPVRAAPPLRAEVTAPRASAVAPPPRPSRPGPNHPWRAVIAHEVAVARKHKAQRATRRTLASA